MLITLGRNVPNGKYAVAMHKIKNEIFIILHKQEDGMCSFSDKSEVAKIKIDKQYLLRLNEFYDKLNI